MIRNTPDKKDEEYMRLLNALSNINQNQNHGEKLNEFSITIGSNKKKKKLIIQKEVPKLQNLLEQFNSSTGPTSTRTKNAKNNSSNINTMSTKINNTKSKNIIDEVNLDDHFLFDNLFDLEKDSDKIEKIKQKMSIKYDKLEDIPSFDIFDYSKIPDSVLKEMKEISLRKNKKNYKKEGIFLRKKRKKNSKWFDNYKICINKVLEIRYIWFNILYKYLL